MLMLMMMMMLMLMMMMMMLLASPTAVSHLLFSSPPRLCRTILPLPDLLSPRGSVTVYRHPGPCAGVGQDTGGVLCLRVLGDFFRIVFFLSGHAWLIQIRMSVVCRLPCDAFIRSGSARLEGGGGVVDVFAWTAIQWHLSSDQTRRFLLLNQLLCGLTSRPALCPCVLQHE